MGVRREKEKMGSVTEDIDQQVREEREPRKTSGLKKVIERKKPKGTAG